ncbi:glycosyltransferase domain-containing protein [Methylophilus aquaticus]|uniref:DUF616 domain-containing protein n=1 Tax=Methylophilus aquaticus TaxID=1971610 RepID=A0ABT9JP62_9PROT|nr:glycosyltransferase domain-containing protein [Methylophilus aquaticus]MDP8566377.1 DUF616 domain-containing protein [Methylophilus aquaticus]
MDMQQLNHFVALADYMQPAEVARILARDDVDDNNAIALYQQRYPVVSTHRPGKIAVYTAIFGGYDSAPVLNHIDPAVDYILYTEEAEFVAPAPWQVRVIPAMFEDPQMDARRVKLLSHLFLYDYDVTVWIDGNFTLEKLTAALIEECVSRAPVALCKHQFRNCIYDEAGEIIRRGIDALTPVLRQIQHYQVRQFPAQFGLHVTSFLVRDHRSANVIKLNMRWWELLSANSKRDQLAFDYVRWECQIPMMALPFNLKNNALYCWGQNGEGKHQQRTRRNNERFGRAFKLADQGEHTYANANAKYSPISERWSKDFLKHWFALNQCLSAVSGAEEASIMHVGDQPLSAHMLPDVRLAEVQADALNLLDHSKRVLLLGYDGGHFALMVLKLTSAKCVVVDENLTPYKQAGLQYLQALYANRLAHFSLQDIQQLPSPMFDLIVVNRNAQAVFAKIPNQVAERVKVMQL